jgi:hypothetical protein
MCLNGGHRHGAFGNGCGSTGSAISGIASMARRRLLDGFHCRMLERVRRQSQDRASTPQRNSLFGRSIMTNPASFAPVDNTLIGNTVAIRSQNFGFNTLGGSSAGAKRAPSLRRLGPQGSTWRSAPRATPASANTGGGDAGGSGLCRRSHPAAASPRVRQYRLRLRGAGGGRSSEAQHH